MIVELPNDVITVALRVAFNHENILEKRICRSCHVAASKSNPNFECKVGHSSLLLLPPHLLSFLSNVSQKTLFSNFLGFNSATNCLSCRDVICVVTMIFESLRLPFGTLYTKKVAFSNIYKPI